MDIKYQILAEEIKSEWNLITTLQLPSDRERMAQEHTLRCLTNNLATRFALYDLAFDANEFMTKCGFKD